MLEPHSFPIMREVIAELINLAGYTPDEAEAFAINQPNAARAFVEHIKAELKKNGK